MIPRNYWVAEDLMTQETKVRILRRAREIVNRPGGWTKGTFVGTKPVNRKYAPMCVGGACQLAAKDLGLLADDKEVLYSTAVACQVSLADLIRARTGLEVTEWNDTDETTKREVVEMIEDRIAELEERPRPSI